MRVVNKFLKYLHENFDKPNIRIVKLSDSCLAYYKNKEFDCIVQHLEGIWPMTFRKVDEKNFEIGLLGMDGEDYTAVYPKSRLMVEFPKVLRKYEYVESNSRDIYFLSTLV